MVYPALLPLMRTPRLPVVDWTDAPRRFKWTRLFRRKTKSGFCACAITFQLACTSFCVRKYWNCFFQKMAELFHKYVIYLFISPLQVSLAIFADWLWVEWSLLDSRWGSQLFCSPPLYPGRLWYPPVSSSLATTGLLSWGKAAGGWSWSFTVM